MEWDHFGFERSHYRPNPTVRLLNDADRMDLIEFVTSEGYGDKVVIAHDVASKQKLTRYGGPASSISFATSCRGCASAVSERKTSTAFWSTTLLRC